MDDSFIYDKNRGCYIWTKSFDDKGYSQVNIGGRIVKAYSIAYKEVIGPVPSGLVLRHICDNRKCINPFHLTLGTQADNINDMYRRGRGCIGDKAPWSKLNEAQVKELRLEFKFTKSSIAEMSRRHNINYGTLSDVLLNKTWKHVVI